MKRIIRQTLFVLGALITSTTFAQVNQSFNTTPATPDLDQIKGILQDGCWIFTDMDVNTGGWNPSIEGDGAMVSGAAGSLISSPGIFSPVLDIPGSMAVGFSYKFDQSVASGASLKLYLVDHNNEMVQEMDNIDLSGKNSTTVYTYNNTLINLPSGAYKLHIEYSGLGNTKIAIDQLQINRPMLYAGGCNNAPVAANDNITGNANRTASGQVFSNDYDPNGDYFSGYIIDNSPHGTVELNTDGSFTFTPNAGFAGTSTTFTYQVCDAGFGPACGNIATATITFSASMLPVRLTDFTVSVNEANDAVIRWTTTYEQGSDRFEIERSFDGSNFETVGNVKAAGTSFARNEYSYTDKLRNSTTSKKDVYYRIRMVDIGNRAEVTKVLVLRMFRTNSLKMVSVTPNPVMNDINVQVQLKENSYIVMKITNNNGVEVSRKSIRGNEGLNVFSLDGTSKLAPGMYMLEVIINSKERMTTRLIKSN
jgi:Bacterial Ig domain